MEDALKELRSGYRAYFLSLAALVAFLWPDPATGRLRSARSEATKLAAAWAAPVDNDNAIAGLDRWLRSPSEGTMKSLAEAKKRLKFGSVPTDDNVHPIYEFRFASSTNTLEATRDAFKADLAQRTLGPAIALSQAFQEETADCCMKDDAEACRGGIRITRIELLEREVRFNDKFRDALLEGKDYWPAEIEYSCSPGVSRTEIVAVPTVLDEARRPCLWVEDRELDYFGHDCDPFPRLHRVWPEVAGATIADLDSSIEKSTAESRSDATVLGLSIRTDQLLGIAPLLIGGLLLGIGALASDLAGRPHASLRMASQKVHLTLLLPGSGRWLTYACFCVLPFLVVVFVVAEHGPILADAEHFGDYWLAGVATLLGLHMLLGGVFVAIRLDAVRDAALTPTNDDAATGDSA